MKTTLKPLVVACSLSLATGAPWALAAQNETTGNQQQTQSQGQNQANASSETQQEQMQQIDEAARVLRDMQQNPELSELLSEAKGVFIIPDYATAALLIGGKGGEGVVLNRDPEGWSNPAFYDIGGVSIGAQIGAEAGALAMILMSDEAIENFKQSNNFSLNANAGLSFLAWSADTQASTGKGEDVVVWSETPGLMAEASLGVSDIMWDEEENQAYYQTSTSPGDVLTGQVNNPHEQQLQQMLPTGQQTAGGQGQQQRNAATTLRQNFDQLDKNGDGRISQDELDALEPTAAGNEDLQDNEQIMNRLDRDDDGAISEQELEQGGSMQNQN